MNNKMVFGVLVTVTGLVFTLFCLIYAVLNPWDYKGITGLLGSLLGTRMLVPFIVSFLFMMSGLACCFWLAFKKNDN